MNLPIGKFSPKELNLICMMANRAPTITSHMSIELGRLPTAEQALDAVRGGLSTTPLTESGRHLATAVIGKLRAALPSAG